MSKNKLSKKVLKAFLDSVKKIESIDLKEKYEEAGKVVANYALILKHKEGKKSKLLKLIAAISEDTGVNELLEKLKSKKKQKAKSKETSKKKSDKKSPVKVSSKSQIKKTNSKKDKTAKKDKKKNTKNKVSKSNLPKQTKEKSVLKTALKKPEPVVAKLVENKQKSKITGAKPISTTRKRVKAVVVSKVPTPAKQLEAKVVAKKTIEAHSITSIPIEKKVITKATAKPIAKKTVSKRKPAIKSISDNLKLIEGIGPKIESFLKEDGIDTFEKLSKSAPEAIQKMLIAKGGTRYNANNPANWPEQATLAAKGDMVALKALKIALKGGKKV